MVTIGIYLLAAAVRACALSRAIMLTDSLLLVNLTSALLRPELPQVPFYRRLGGGGHLVSPFSAKTIHLLSAGW